MALYGAVQGVGFRPFVYRLATEMGLAGWVLNSSAGLVVEVDGAPEELERFLERLEAEQPRGGRRPRSRSELPRARRLHPIRDRRQRPGQREVRGRAARSGHLPAVPGRALRPANRRFEYPFTNCTAVRPALHHHPGHPLRPAEHHHARVHALPRLPARVHGPARPAVPRPAERLPEVRAAALHGRSPTRRRETLRRARILALKGIGGFQLLADARQPGGGGAPAPAASTAKRSRSR